MFSPAWGKISAIKVGIEVFVDRSQINIVVVINVLNNELYITIGAKLNINGTSKIDVTS